MRPDGTKVNRSVRLLTFAPTALYIGGDDAALDIAVSLLRNWIIVCVVKNRAGSESPFRTGDSAKSNLVGSLRPPIYSPKIRLASELGVDLSLTLRPLYLGSWAG